MSETLILAIVLIPCLIVAIVFHEVAHGWTALALGDPTAKEQRRLSFNPIRHIDPVGTLLVPGFLAFVGGPVFGWAKPVPVRKSRLNNPRFGMMAVAAAGPLMNLFLATVGAIMMGLIIRESVWPLEGISQTIAMGLNYFLIINIFLAMFNLLPIPPFDGSHILEGLLPPRWAKQYVKLRPIGMVLLLGLILLTWFAPQLGVIENVVFPPVEWLQHRFLGLADWVITLGA